MSPVAMSVASDSYFAPFLDALRTAPTGPGEQGARSNVFQLPKDWIGSTDAKAAADRLAREISNVGLQSLR